MVMADREGREFCELPPLRRLRADNGLLHLATSEQSVYV
jgi:hypothetical protein